MNYSILLLYTFSLHDFAFQRSVKLETYRVMYKINLFLERHCVI